MSLESIAVMSSEVACQTIALCEGWRHPARLPGVFTTGLKAWPRGLRPRRCGLDSALNDGYEDDQAQLNEKNVILKWSPDYEM